MTLTEAARLAATYRGTNWSDRALFVNADGSSKLARLDAMGAALATSGSLAIGARALHQAYRGAVYGTGPRFVYVVFYDVAKLTALEVPIGSVAGATSIVVGGS